MTIQFSKQAIFSLLIGGGSLLIGIGAFSLSSNLQERLRANILVSSGEVSQSTSEIIRNAAGAISTAEVSHAATPPSIVVATTTPSVSVVPRTTPLPPTSLPVQQTPTPTSSLTTTTAPVVQKSGETDQKAVVISAPNASAPPELENLNINSRKSQQPPINPF